MEIMHDESRNQFRMDAEGLVAHVAYEGWISVIRLCRNRWKEEGLLLHW